MTSVRALWPWKKPRLLTLMDFKDFTPAAPTRTGSSDDEDPIESSSAGPDTVTHMMRLQDFLEHLHARIEAGQGWLVDAWASEVEHATTVKLPSNGMFRYNYTTPADYAASPLRR